jgi:acetoin utilization deacetylase AcuC-like enzyme
MLPIWYSPIYTDGLDPEARFPRARYRDVRQRLVPEVSSGQIEFIEPTPLDIDHLHLAHDPSYCDAFLNGTLSLDAERRIGLRPWTPDIVQRTLILTHGTVEATRRVMTSGGIAANLGGGTHHAYRDFGSGYCIFNDLAIAARIAQRDHAARQVMILDLDVHQGDGTAAIFADDPSVETISFHCSKNFPFRKTQSDHDEIFEPGTTDDVFLDRLTAFLSERATRELPDLILFQAGVDALATDRLGHLNLTREGMQFRNRLVFEFARTWSIPLVMTMGGGYGEPLETSVDAHADLFRQAAQIQVGAELPLKMSR